MKKQVKEIILWIFIAMPFVYLATIWNQLPEQVPTHFGLDGVADDWSDKSLLWIIPGALGMGIYFLMLAIPVLDPKRKIRQMGDKYFALRFILTVFFSVLSVYLIFASKTGSIESPNLLLALGGAFFAILGNYLQTVRPNYFIGIRTPWTLENEQVWNKTHRMGGRIWILGGILIMCFAFLVSDSQLYTIIFAAILSVMVLVPVVYSYTEFRKQKDAIQS
jgi:uncharacterized membrane protein